VLADRLRAAADFETFEAADQGNHESEQRRLGDAEDEMPDADICCNSVRNMVGLISRVSAHTMAPPSMPDIIAMKVSAGIATSSASTRGSTSRVMGSRPRARIASISSLAFIEPICAVKALAVRPAIRIAVSNTANSRKKENATRSTV